MKKFELFMCCLGNGITVCNKAVMEHGDYKHIAHISDCGKITWYVEPNSIPGDVLLIIEHDADAMYSNWNEYINGMSELKAYEYLLDRLPHAAFMHVVQEMKNAELWERIHYMKMVYCSRATF